MSKCSKTIYFIGKYQFTMACIRALVMSVYKITICLISQPKHFLWVLIKPVLIPNYRLNLMCMKILTIFH